ncbi:MAG: hypothetical protein HQM13_16180 [SAR324 cluster bacterium]|nr:hypothetical protein [SAR324 cluster bacterium]
MQVSRNPNQTLLTVLYWLLPIILWILQLIYTLNSLNQIRFEELAESIRNVYWLEQNTIYDGISSNVGYYGTLLLIYKFLGFSIHLAKFARLAIHLFSLLCLAALLQRYLGKPKAWLILLTVGLSPTWLYFNTLQTSYGIDLQYISICLFLVSFNPFNSRFSLFQSLIFGITMMIAWMSYPTFILYLPLLFILYTTSLVKKRQTIRIHFAGLHICLCAAGFVLPFLFALYYLKDPALLILDPNTQKGIFRGGGTLLWEWQSYIANVKQVLKDLFQPGSSYYFELKHVEFSNLFIQIPSVLILLYGFFLLATNRALRPLLIAAFSLLLITLIIPNLAGYSAPGIRRATGLIPAFYAIFAGVWYYLTSHKIPLLLKRMGMLICIFPLFHHLAVYIPNYSAIADPSRYRNVGFFAVKETPQQSFQEIFKYVENNQMLICLDVHQQPQVCRYSEIFAAIAGHQKWNGLKKKPVFAYDWRSKNRIQLSTKLWEDYYFPH